MSRARGIAVLVAASVLLAGCGNKGEDTLCPDFLKMSATQRGDVIAKMGFNAKYTTKSKQVAEAVRSCSRARGTNDEYDTVGQVLGP